jgi:hypothetical protein
MAVCDPSGMLPTENCPTIVNEVFLAGNEPTQSDTLYRRMQINRETGLLATVFTPPELVEERVYLLVPPEAQEWAQNAGLTTPPDTYDVIIADSTSSKNTQITTPQMFAYVHGKVKVTGSAGGAGFDYYRLLVGQGLNPQRWLQIGEDRAQSATSDELGVWDTLGLSGLYARQLQVVYQDQHVETALVQITVDNQSPEVTILYPKPGENIISTSRGIALQAQVTDDLALKSVEFYVDERLVSSLTQAPFTIVWQATTGAHVLRVRALDQAGNASEAEIQFVVK